MSPRAWWVAGCVVGLLAVGFGALGAHSFKAAVKAGTHTAAQLEWLEVGVRYAAHHSVALLAVAWLASLSGSPSAAPSATPSASQRASRATTVAGVAFVAGVTLFTGSLLLMAFTGTKALPIVLATPLGGLSLMVGWAALAWAGFTALARPKPVA